MEHAAPAYGLWLLVIINSAVFIIFAFSFTRPKTKRDWRSFGAFSAFIFALFAEMYGVLLTIYFLSGWLANRYPGLDPFGHDAGHLWYTILGFKGNPHTNPIHLISNLLVLSGFFLLAPRPGRFYSRRNSTITLQQPGLMPGSGIPSTLPSC